MHPPLAQQDRSSSCIDEARAQTSQSLQETSRLWRAFMKTYITNATASIFNISQQKIIDRVVEQMITHKQLSLGSNCCNGTLRSTPSASSMLYFSFIKCSNTSSSHIPRPALRPDPRRRRNVDTGGEWEEEISRNIKISLIERRTRWITTKYYSSWIATPTLRQVQVAAVERPLELCMLGTLVICEQSDDQERKYQQWWLGVSMCCANTCTMRWSEEWETKCVGIWKHCCRLQEILLVAQIFLAEEETQCHS